METVGRAGCVAYSNYLLYLGRLHSTSQLCQVEISASASVHLQTSVHGSADWVLSKQFAWFMSQARKLNLKPYLLLKIVSSPVFQVSKLTREIRQLHASLSAMLAETPKERAQIAALTISGLSHSTVWPGSWLVVLPDLGNLSVSYTGHKHVLQPSLGQWGLEAGEWGIVKAHIMADYSFQTHSSRKPEQ